MARTAFVAYYIKENDGVASLRSRTLVSMLDEMNVDYVLISRDTFGKRAAKNKLIWCISLFFYLLRIDFEKLYVSCGPFWHLRFVYFVSLIKKKELIIDFRDPWSHNLKTGFGGSKPIASDKVVKEAIFYEKALYKQCTRFWVCTPGMKKLYGDVFGDDNKIEVVLNGHNIVSSEEDVKKEQINNRLTYVCLGKFSEYGVEKAETLLKELAKECKEKDIDFLLEFIGTDPNKNRPLIEKVGLTDHARFLEPMPYQEAINRASKADIGLCLVRDEEIEFGTKVFDYIGLGLPIYDGFNEKSTFSEFFSPYLTKTTRKNIPTDERQRFYRKEIYRNFIAELTPKK